VDRAIAYGDPLKGTETVIIFSQQLTKITEVKRMKKALIIVLAATILLSTWFSTSLSFAYIPDGEVNAAWFRNDPYPFESANVTVYFHHDSEDTMSISLLNPSGVTVQTWSIDAHTGYKYYAASNVKGIWMVRCFVEGVQTYSDLALQSFNIPDQYPSENNSASDWARHPQDWRIYAQALSIVGQTDSSLEAAHRIYLHVLANFVHDDYADMSFRKDLDLLTELNGEGHYVGVCRSDAVLLTAYARALGIPSRIIHSNAVGGPSHLEDNHYFAELNVLNGTDYQWVPVDGDPEYDWFGLDEANEYITRVWPSEYPDLFLDGWTFGVTTVTSIPYGNIENSGFTEAAYTGDNTYTNFVDI
jgi:hypothetical protein